MARAAFCRSRSGPAARNRIGEGIDIAKAAVFLASSASSFIAGIELFVDGGIDAV